MLRTLLASAAITVALSVPAMAQFQVTPTQVNPGNIYPPNSGIANNGYTYSPYYNTYSNGPVSTATCYTCTYSNAKQTYPQGPYNTTAPRNPNAPGPVDMSRRLPASSPGYTNIPRGTGYAATARPSYHYQVTPLHTYATASQVHQTSRPNPVNHFITTHHR
jgi:hypothetical protein